MFSPCIVFFLTWMKRKLQAVSHVVAIMTKHLAHCLFWNHWIRKTIWIWSVLVMQVCCRLHLTHTHLSTRGSESVTKPGKNGMRLSLFLERQGGFFTSFHSQAKVSICFPFFLAISICPASALLACICFPVNIVFFFFSLLAAPANRKILLSGIAFSALSFLSLFVAASQKSPPN